MHSFKLSFTTQYVRHLGLWRGIFPAGR